MLDLPLNEALIGLRQKQVDAVIQVIGAPADSIRDALTDVSLRLVPLSERAVTALVASDAGYFAHTIPRGAYATQKQDVRTIATAALLLVGADLAESEVAAITRYVFGQTRDFAARGSAQGTQVSAANARLGLSIPMHIAAAKALEGLSKPTARLRRRLLPNSQSEADQRVAMTIAHAANRADVPRSFMEVLLFRYW